MTATVGNMATVITSGIFKGVLAPLERVSVSDYLTISASGWIRTPHDLAAQAVALDAGVGGDEIRMQAYSKPDMCPHSNIREFCPYCFGIDDDPEFTALKDVFAALDPLEPEQRLRIMAYITARLCGDS